ncbi:MAG: hydantoinase/oxoprolinase family protein, partial [Halobacteriaceae archaeon]
RVAARFHDAHEQRYGHKSESEPLELVNVRVDAVGVADPPSIEGLAPTDTTLAAARKGTRPAYFGGDRHETAVYDRLDLPAGEAFDGPGVVEGPESTTVVHPDQTATTDRHGNLLVESGGGR